ncbi:UDP-N-acetylmuramate--L-alanine ligase [Desulfocicer vacuolatum DSM 3385]|uniref:UDP-N-acetylmuramate--L-alanine ligase n=1 Tax=Desulfocicer vacuolatum DSM 3385 TaxID=1121400 RepID=A0A1W2B9X3_9BACT|nr:UDP-N-acetylmuramate:L-alanyl-gamma-D-glutamyl-meso-diaminopimelate ligase [Desulfocicer vacuolatum]SMC69591.1 UDP-N-acetylmuramate--L-alanine ligase [Desulfocicer vacuolatum DSM 3385]
MDFPGNRIPDHVKIIHMIAACGTGMGALACMLQDLGYQVTGSDHQVYPPMSDFLAEKGVTLSAGFSPSHLEPAPDLVIIGNAVTRDNVEARHVMAHQIPYCSMPQALNHFVARDKKIILVTGTHGKTTTSAIVAHLLQEAGLDPTFMIGGILKNFNSNYRLGNGAYIVIEGDEYDTAFFDKGPKFLHYPPHITIMNGIEFDHADIFRDIDHIKDVFKSLVNIIPSQGIVLANGMDLNLMDVLKNANCAIECFGEGDYHWSFAHHAASHGASVGKNQTDIHIRRQGGGELDVHSPLMGRHNAMNTIAAVAALMHLGVPGSIVASSMATFKGVKRRQEIRGIKQGITVMDDFAHHPTAVKETIAALKPFYDNGNVIAVFEPRTNSSMRDIFQRDYALAFDHADLICIREPSRLDKVPENERLSTKKLVNDIRERGKDAFYFKDTESILLFLTDRSREGDLVLIMSNGGFDNIHQRFLELL